jgi:hypothetical protein
LTCHRSISCRLVVVFAFGDDGIRDEGKAGDGHAGREKMV